MTNNYLNVLCFPYYLVYEMELLWKNKVTISIILLVSNNFVPSFLDGKKRAANLPLT